MVIQQINKQHVLEAIHYIDENGVPDRNTSTGYVLVTEDGRKIPPKYVIAVARKHLRREIIFLQRILIQYKQIQFWKNLDLSN